MADEIIIETTSAEVIEVGVVGPQGPKGADGAASLTTAGDLLYRNNVEATRLPVGSNGQVLKVSGGLPAWGNESGAVTSVNGQTGSVSLTANDVSAVPASAFTTAGDMIFRNSAGAIARLPLGLQGSLLSVGNQGAPFWAAAPITTNVYFIANKTVNGSFVAGGNDITSYSVISNRLVQIVVSQTTNSNLTINLNTSTVPGIAPQNGDTVRIDVAAKSGQGQKVIVSTGFETFDAYYGHSMYFIYTSSIGPARWVRCVEPYNRPAPATKTDTGVPGEFAVDARYIYFCTGINQWRRVAIANW